MSVPSLFVFLVFVVVLIESFRQRRRRHFFCPGVVAPFAKRKKKEKKTGKKRNPHLRAPIQLILRRHTRRKHEERQNEWQHGRRERQFCRESRFGTGARFAFERTHAVFDEMSFFFVGDGVIVVVVVVVVVVVIVVLLLLLFPRPPTHEKESFKSASSSKS